MIDMYVGEGCEPSGIEMNPPLWQRGKGSSRTKESPCPDLRCVNIPQKNTHSIKIDFSSTPSSTQQLTLLARQKSIRKVSCLVFPCWSSLRSEQRGNKPAKPIHMIVIHGSELDSLARDAKPSIMYSSLKPSSCKPIGSLAWARTAGYSQ